MIWNEAIECADRATIEEIQLEKLKKVVAHAYENQMPYREKMVAAGVTPGDIQSLDDIRKLPFVTKDDLGGNPILLFYR